MKVETNRVLDQVWDVKHTSWFTPMSTWNNNSNFLDIKICRYNAIIVCFNSTCKQWNMSTLKFGLDFTTFCFMLEPILLGSVLTFIHSHLSWFQLCNKNVSLDLSIWTKSHNFFPICKTKTSKVVSPYNQKALLFKQLLQHQRF